MGDPGFPVFDADNHLYESPEMLSKYLPKQYARDIQFVQVRGRQRIAVRGKITDYMPNPTFERVAAPGAHVDFYRGTNPEGKSLREMAGDPIDCLPAFREPGPRLELLDELHVHRALMFPTLANLLEYILDGDPDLTHAAVHAVNQWLDEVWSFDYKDRIFTVQHREVEDALAAMICHGALTRFPDLLVYSVENGADWVPHLLEQLEIAYGRMPQSFEEHPVEVFRRNVYVNPFWEDDVVRLADLVTVEHVLFGSDYPHPEGLAEPLDYLDHLSEYRTFDDTAKRLIMSENANHLLGLSIAA